MAEKGKAVVDVKEKLRKEAAEGIAKRIQQGGGASIRVTQNKKFLLPNGKESDGPLTAVIVEFSAANLFFDAPFKEGDKENHLACYAVGDDPNNLVPSDKSPDKQSQLCATCDNNQFPAAGGPKPCQNTRQLILIEPGGGADAPLMRLKVSPTGIRAFDAHVAKVNELTGMFPISVVTDIYFADDKRFPSLRFKIKEQNGTLEVHAARQEEAKKLLAFEPDVSTYKPPAPVKAKGKR